MKIPLDQKHQIVALIIEQLEAELSNCEEAANNAHKAAVDDQSVAETQYDTLAIEAAYLAEGQSRRLLEIKASVHQYQQLKRQIQEINIPPYEQVSAGALVELIDQQEFPHLYFIGPTAGGIKLKTAWGSITVISLGSPIGNAIKGKRVDDEYNFKVGYTSQSGYIQNIT